MLRMVLYSFLMGVVFLCAWAYQQTIYVLVDEGNHLPQTCTANRKESTDSEDNTTIMTCNSIASLAIILNNNSFKSIEVILHSGVHRLTEPISFSYVNVTIRPTNNTGLAHIVCANESVGGVQPVIQFMHSRRVQISRVHIEDCSGNVFIRNISHLLIHDCSFRYFSNGAVDVSNVISIAVLNTTFEHNGPVTNVLRTYDRFIIHSGGLSIGSNILDERTLSNTTPNIMIHNCRFINNSAVPSDDVQLKLAEVFVKKLFNGRGGGLGIILNSPQHPYNVLVSNCTFKKNYAKRFGGGVFAITGGVTSHNIKFDGNVFVENESGFVAGGSFVGSIGPGTQSTYDTFVFTGCSYYSNLADRGGGAVYSVPGTQGAGFWNFMQYSNCIFRSNVATVYAAGLWLNSIDPYSILFNHKPVEVTNCSFINNIATDTAIMGAVFTPVVLSGSTIFKGNYGSSLELFGSIATFADTVEFSLTDSQLSNTGALHLVSFAQIVLHKGLSITFTNNTGKFGGAITVVSQTPETFSRVLYNPLCFLRYEAQQTPPNQWNVSMSFIGNSATVGSVGYLYSTSSCSWDQFEDPYFDSAQVLNWKFVQQSNNSNSFHTGEYLNQRFNVQTETTKIVVVNESVTVFPGETFGVKIIAYDEKNHAVGIAVTLTHLQDLVLFKPSASVLIIDDELLFTTASYKADHNRTTDDRYEILVRGFNQINSVLSASFMLQLSTCPPGYFLKQDTTASVCECTKSNPKIITCNDTQITLNGQTWASADNTSADHIFTYPCPTGYCQCDIIDNGECVHTFTSSLPDEQCTCDRKGVLCGECNGNSSLTVLLLNCVSDCGNYNWIIIIVWFVFASILLVIFVRVLLHAQFHSAFFPVLYYLQFLPIGTVSIASGFSSFHDYPYYLYSAIGFYLPYNFCLSNIGPLGIYSLQLVPLLLVFIIVPLTLGISWKWLKKSMKPWYSVWMLVILIFPNTVSSAVSVLFCPTIHKSRRWYFAGHIECFSGNHLPLAILAVSVLVLCCFVVIGTFILAICRVKISSFRRLKDSLDNLESVKYPWFFSYDLLRRFVPILFAIIFPGNKYPVFFVFLIMVSVVVYMRPYPSSTANNVESVLFISTTIMYLISFQDLFEISILSSMHDAKDCAIHKGYNGYTPVSTMFVAALYFVPFICAILLVFVVISRKVIKHFCFFLKSKSMNEPHQMNAQGLEGDCVTNQVAISYNEVSVDAL